MPSPRRSLRHRSAADAAPYCRKAKDRPIKKDRNSRKVRVVSPTSSLSDDALAGIFARLSDAAAVVRCAATCRRWGRVVATSAAIVSRSLPPLGRFLPDLAVGLFHQEMDLPAAESPLPCFVPMGSADRFLGAGQQRLLSLAGLGDDGGVLDHSRPVASRNGRLVLELRREGRAADGGIRLAVCNPMMHDNSIVLVPPLMSSSGTIKDYGCALLTGQDLRPPRCNSFFRLLLVYNHHNCGPGNSTVLRCYCSDTGCWGREAECSVEIPSLKICDIGQAVVRRGVAFWALDHGVLGAHLDRIDQHGAVMDMHLVPYGYSEPHTWPDNRLLGISPDNRLFFMDVGVVGWKNKILMAKLSYFEFAEEDNIRTGKKGNSREEESLPMPQMKVSHANTSIKLRWFGEKSGLVLFTMGRPSGHKGTFVLNLHDKVVTKVAIFGDSWKNLLGYEMDMAAYLASSVELVYPKYVNAHFCF